MCNSSILSCLSDIMCVCVCRCYFYPFKSIDKETTKLNKQEHVRMCRCVCCFVCYIELKVFKMFDKGFLESKNPFCSHLSLPCLSLSLYRYISSILMDKRFWALGNCKVRSSRNEWKIRWIREKKNRWESNQRQAALNDSRRI